MYMKGVRFIIFFNVVLSLMCNNSGVVDTDTQETDIEGSYLLTECCMNSYSKQGTKIDTQLTVTGYDSIACGCASALVDSFLSMSTLIITADSIVRFGFHCPGSNSGTTRIAYGYKVIRDRIVGDSLTRKINAGENRAVRITDIDKHSDESITITQHSYYTESEIDSTYYTVYIGEYEKSDSVLFKYNDIPTCSDNYSPWFPIPFW